MAQPSERPVPPALIIIGSIGLGVVMLVGSAVLIQFIPIRLFVLGMILGAVLIILGLIAPIVSLFTPKPPLPLLYGERGELMIGFHCLKCGQEFICERSKRGDPFECPKCGYTQQV